MAGLRLILVTPEKTLFDRTIRSARVPMYDGSAGIYPGRAAMVGRLGTGELSCETESGASESWLIDSGFIQVKGESVSVLTEEAIPRTELSRKAASTELEEAKAQKATTDEDFASAERKLKRARQMLRLATKE